VTLSNNTKLNKFFGNITYAWNLNSIKKIYRADIYNIYNNVRHFNDLSFSVIKYLVQFDKNIFRLL